MKTLLPIAYVLVDALRHGVLRSRPSGEFAVPIEKHGLLDRVEPGFLRQSSIALFLMLANAIASFLRASPRSTVICETLAAVPASAFMLQCLSVLTDLCILLSTMALIQHLEGFGYSDCQPAPLLFGFALLVSTAVLGQVGFEKLTGSSCVLQCY